MPRRGDDLLLSQPCLRVRHREGRHAVSGDAGAHRPEAGGFRNGRVLGERGRAGPGRIYPETIGARAAPALEGQGGGDGRDVQGVGAANGVQRGGQRGYGLSQIAASGGGGRGGALFRGAGSDAGRYGGKLAEELRVPVQIELLRVRPSVGCTRRSLMPRYTSGVFLIDDIRCKRLLSICGRKTPAGDSSDESHPAVGRGSSAQRGADGGRADAGGGRGAETAPALGDAV